MKNKIKILLVVLLFFSMCNIASADTTTIDVIVISENDITGYINATSVNGSVSYFIDGIEVKGEFNDIWNSIVSTHKLAKNAQSSANYAFSYADNAYRLARDTNNSVVSLSFIVENNTHKIYMLRDELIFFQDDYIRFKNNTINFINFLEYRISSNEINISSLSDKLENLANKHEQLREHMYLLLIPIFGFIACFVVLLWVLQKQQKYIFNMKKQFLLEKQIYKKRRDIK